MVKTKRSEARAQQFALEMNLARENDVFHSVLCPVQTYNTPCAAHVNET